MTTILYVHGFNSAGGGAKAVAITKQFPKYKVLSPTFNYKDFKSVLKQLNSLFLMNKINLVVGTSLGGFFALYAAAKHNVKCVAINPVTDPSATLTPILGEQRNYMTKERYIVTAADIKPYEDFAKGEFLTIQPTNDNFCFLLSEDDELLGDHHYLEQKYPQCHNFRYFTGFGHRFNTHKPIFQAIEELLSDRR